MSKIKLTKGELKKQRDSLKQFRRYLPTLQLKKQQLQMKILEVQRQLSEKESFIQEKKSAMSQWWGVFADPEIAAPELKVNFKNWLTPMQIFVDRMNIAGADIPVFKDIKMPEVEYDLYAVPLWVDLAIQEMRQLVVLLAERAVIRKQIAILQQELRVTTQRVNLFEKVKIPECRENIRRIRIYLGDQQANAIGVSKVAKHKVELRDEEAVLV